MSSVPVDDHGGLLVYRMWHSASHTPSADTARTFGRLFRFDPHPEQRPTDDPSHMPVWYGAEAFETAAREVLDRTGPTGWPRQIEVCVRQRIAAIRLAQPTHLLDLTSHAQQLRTDDTIGDDPQIDYRTTRAWARTIHQRFNPDGLRYYSARHRTPTGERAGVNIVVWGSSPGEVIADVPAATGGAWQRLTTMFAQVNAALVPTHGCARCKIPQHSR